MLDLSGEGIKIHVLNKTASNFRKAEKAEKNDENSDERTTG